MNDLYDLSETPPAGIVPAKMHASIIRRDRFGPPAEAFKTEVVDVPAVGPGDVLVWVMAAGINYNSVWAALGRPVDVIGMRQKMGAAEDYHIGGSEGSGIVWAVGPGVRGVRVGDHVVLGSVQWDEHAQDVRFGSDPMTSTTANAWGYELNFGTFAQFALAKDYQCHPKPPALTWEAAAAFLLCGATAYRQLFGWPPNTVQPGDPVLIWGGAGGLGSMAIQLVRNAGGIPVAVVSTQERGEYCQRLGARGFINRSDFGHWGRMPALDDEQAMSWWLAQVRGFGKRFWETIGERRSPKIVFEHAGQDTLPTSMYLCDNAGMVVGCGATSGYAADIDLRYLWMRQKRLQGSHGANAGQYRATVRLADSGLLDPCLSLTLPFERIGDLHQLLYENRQPPGNLAALVNATAPGLTDGPG